MMEQSAMIEADDRVTRYIVSPRGIVHRWGKCRCRYGRIITSRPGETVVGWLYWTPCRRCKP